MAGLAYSAPITGLDTLPSRFDIVIYPTYLADASRLTVPMISLLQ